MPSDHDLKREEIAEEVEPTFKGGPIWRRPAGKIAVIWVIMTAIGVVIGLLLPDHIFPRIMSPQGKDARDTVIFFTVLAAPVTALVLSIGLYSLLAWRKKTKGEEPPADGWNNRGSGLVEAIWVGGSLVLVVVLLIWGMAFLASETNQQNNVLKVNVTGQQWLWTFSYPGTGVQSNQLVIPLGRQVEFDVTSMDVTHGFWPVELGNQIDANPGFITRITMQPNKLGKFDVRCSQICGLYHSYMDASGTVLSPSDYAQWLVQHGASTTSAQSYALGSN